MIHPKCRPAKNSAYTANEATLQAATVDSALSYEEAVLSGLPSNCPQEILDAQVVLEVYYYSFDGKVHRGQIVVHEEVADEVEAAFIAAFKEKFPITSVIPVSQFAWDDDLSMNADNTSSFNYRTIAFTKVMSRHSLGKAIDINPRLNPHYRGDGTIVPPNATYEAGKPGVLVEGDPFVRTLKGFGWSWEGNHSKNHPDGIDWQHFEKV